MAVDIDVWEVIRAAKTKPFGSWPLSRTRLGGHCIPIDPFYLTWEGPAKRPAHRFIELLAKSNRMPAYVVNGR